MIVIQHQPGIISWQELVDLVDMARKLPVCTIVTLHSTASLHYLGDGLTAELLYSLAAVERLVVHTLRDMENLRAIGIVDNVVMIPHGARAGHLPAPRDPVATTASPVIGCYGFFVAHKGIATLIAAFAILVAEFPGARLVLVNAEFPSEGSRREVLTCRALARQLCVDHAVTWHTRYLQDAASVALLGECDLIVMPYGETADSASGAVRLALQSGRPVAASHVAIFDELEDAVHRIDAGSAATLAADLARLLGNDALRLTTRDAAGRWLERHDWGTISARLFGMAAALAQQTGFQDGQGRTSLRADSPLLMTAVGARRDGYLVFSGERAGYGVFGPYSRLGAEAYVVRYEFDACAVLTGTARFEVSSHAVTHTLAVARIDFPQAGDAANHATLSFLLAEPAFEVEFRIFCELGFRARLLAVSFGAGGVMQGPGNTRPD